MQELSARKNFFFHSISYLFIRGLPFISSLVVAKFLTVDEFGRYMTIISLFFSLGLIVDLGFSLATTKIVAHRAGNIRGTASVILSAVGASAVLGGAIAAGIGFGASGIAHFFLADASLEELIVAGTLYVPATAIASTATAALQGAQRYRELTFSSFIGGSVFLALVAVGALHGDVFWVIWMASVGAAFRALVVIVPVLLHVRSALQILHLYARVMRDLRELWHIALPASLAALTFTPVNTFILAVLYRNPGGAGEAGWFGLALQVFSIVMVLPGILTQYALPKFASLADDDSRDIRSVTLRQFAMLSTAIGIIAAAPIALSAQRLLNLIAPDYTGGSSALCWMMVAAALAAPQGVISNFLLAMSKNWTRVLTRLLWASVIVGCILAFPQFEAREMAIVYAIAWATILVAQMAIIAWCEH